jgi:hypothetical protein
VGEGYGEPELAVDLVQVCRWRPCGAELKDRLAGAEDEVAVATRHGPGLVEGQGEGGVHPKGDLGAVALLFIAAVVWAVESGMFAGSENPVLRFLDTGLSSVWSLVRIFFAGGDEMVHRLMLWCVNVASPSFHIANLIPKSYLPI